MPIRRHIVILLIFCLSLSQAAQAYSLARLPYHPVQLSSAVRSINNKGNVGKTLNDLGKRENVKALVTAMITAGALQGIGQNIDIGGKSLASINAKSPFLAQLQKNLIDSAASTVINHAINGGNLQQQLEQSLRSAFIDTGAAQSANWIGDQKFDSFNNKLAHAIAGCAAGAAKANDCGAGALGAVVGEISAELYGGNRTNNSGIDEPAFKTDTVNFARMMAGIAAAITGGDAEAINLAAAAGGNAAENNRLLHPDEQDSIKKLAKGDPEKEARLTAAACAKVQCFAEFPPDSDAYKQLKQLADIGNSPALAAERQLIDAQGGQFKYTTTGLFNDQTQDNLKLLNNTYQLTTRGMGALQVVGGTAQMVAGGAMALGGGVTCPETRVGCAVMAGGAIVAGSGYDVSKAGFNTAITGTPTATWGESILQNELGLSPQAASLTYAAIGLSPAAADAAAINSATKAFGEYNTYTRSTYAEANATLSTGNAETSSLKNLSGSTSASANAARSQYYGNGGSASPSLGADAAGSSGGSIGMPQTFEGYAGLGGNTSGVSIPSTAIQTYWPANGGFLGTPVPQTLNSGYQFSRYDLPPIALPPKSSKALGLRA